MLFSGTDIIFKFDNSVLLLNQQMKKENFLFKILFYLIVLYYLIAFASPIFFTYLDGLLD